MPLTLPNLDDRTYADLVEEARALIPVSAPEWTNHNESDPGITLIELFAYLTEMLIYRLNRITDAETMAFLTLINGPNWNSSGDLREDKRLTVQSLRQPFRAVTRSDYENLALSGSYAVAIARAKCVSRRNLSPGGRVTYFFSSNPNAVPADAPINLDISKLRQQFFIGASQPFNKIQFDFATAGQGYDLFYQYSSASGGWAAFSPPAQLIDSTANWTADGFLEFNLPPETWAQKEINGQSQYWIGIGTSQDPSTVATARITLDESNHLSLCIVPADTSFDNVLTPRVGAVDSYVDHTTRTRAERQIPFSLDANAGTPFLYIGSLTPFSQIYFQLSTPGVGYQLQFKYSSGSEWTPVVAQDGTNNLANSGLVTFNSLLSSPSLAWTQTEVSGDTRYWICVTSSAAPGTVAKANHIARVQIEMDGLTERVRTDLDQRRLVATRLHVIEPNYVEIKVQASLYIKPDAFEATVCSAAVKALQFFFDPLYGGRDKQGWPFGRNVYASEIYELLDHLAGVDYVESVILPAQEANVIRILPHELVAISITEADIKITSVQAQQA
jgi:hypothetical protein